MNDATMKIFNAQKRQNLTTTTRSDFKCFNVKKKYVC